MTYLKYPSMFILFSGIIIGSVFGGLTLYEYNIQTERNVDEYVCTSGTFTIKEQITHLTETTVLGEQIICAKDWHMSSIFGPTITKTFETKDALEVTKESWERWHKFSLKHQEWHKNNPAIIVKD